MGCSIEPCLVNKFVGQWHKIWTGCVVGRVNNQTMGKWTKIIIQQQEGREEREGREESKLRQQQNVRHVRGGGNKNSPIVAGGAVLALDLVLMCCSQAI